MSVGARIDDRKDRPAYVSFHKVAVEDKVASLREGRYVAKDVDFVHITPPYTRDLLKLEIPSWFADLDQNARAGRIPREWVENYKKMYAAWQQGQELPLDGTPIKGWGMLSPAKQETYVAMKVMTVEDLAAMNDDGCRRAGMGSINDRNMARAWISQTKDKGPLTQEMAALQQQNTLLTGSVENLTRQVNELMAALKAQQYTPVVDRQAPAAEITASDIMPKDDL